MSGAGFILAINLFVAGLFAVAFGLVAIYNRTDRVARWFALAYVFGALYLVFEFVLPTQEAPRLVYIGGFTAFLGAVTAVTIGIAKRYELPVPWMLLAVVCGLTVGANYAAFDLGRDSLLRMMTYQAPYAFMQGLGAVLILRSRRRHAMDLALLVMFSFSALQFLSKPFLALATGGPGASPQQYISSDYALYSQSLGAVLSVGIGLLMLMLLVRDMLAEITAKSETDTLSGLYNRRGFDERTDSAVHRGGVPASLVVCDLDHFKQVNDTYGHDAGDRVIEAFAGVLREAAPERAIAARWGGEEFIVFLPGTNLGTARLFAESVRTAFAALPIAGVPAGTRFTASFGVAEHQGLPAICRIVDNLGEPHARLALRFSRRRSAPITTPTQDDGISPCSWSAWLAELDRQHLALKILDQTGPDFEFVERKDLN